MSTAILRLAGVCLLLAVATGSVRAESGFLRTHQSISQGGQFAGIGLAVDPSSGDLFLSGDYSGASVFAGQRLNSQSAGDAFVMRLAPTLDSRWVRQIRGGGANAVRSLALDPQENSYATGTATTAALIEGGAQGDASIEASGTFMFVVKYDGQGNRVWHRWATSEKEYVHGSSVGVDGAGNVYAAGWFAGTHATFGSQIVSGGGGLFTPFVAKYDAQGTLQWVEHAMIAEAARINAMAVHADGTLTVAGDFSGSIVLDTIMLTSSGQTDLFVARYDGDGQVDWARRAGGPGPDTAHGLAALASGGVLVTGEFTGSAVFGEETVTTAGDSDAVVASYEAFDGRVSWVKAMGGPGRDAARAAAVHYTGQIAVAGEFSDDLQLGDQVLTSRGGTDVFVTFHEPSGRIVAGHGGGGAFNDVGRTVVWQGQTLILCGGFTGAAVFGDAHPGTHSEFEAGEMFLSFLGEQPLPGDVPGDLSRNGQLGLEDAIFILRLLSTGG